MMYTLIERKDYKAIKHMDRQEMSRYLCRVYERGYKKALEDAKKSKIEVPVEQDVLQPAT